MRIWGALVCLVLAARAGRPAVDDAIEAAAIAGDPRAQLTLGHMHATGIGRPLDGAAAVRWWRPAAEAGLVLAQNNMGSMHVRGEGVARDLAEALKWYRMAAAQGNPRSQRYVSLAYAQGLGVEKDPDQAACWAALATANTSAEADIVFGTDALEGRPQADLSDAETAARFRAGAEAGSARAQYYYALALINGVGIAADPRAAAQWMERSARQGSVDAAHSLGLMHALGLGLPRNPQAAQVWFRIAEGLESDIGAYMAGLNSAALSVSEKFAADASAAAFAPRLEPAD